MKMTSLLISFFALAIFAVGCTDSKPNDDDDHGDEHGEAGHEEHEHGTGKHGGHIIDIGREHAYHAEFVDDHDKEMVTVYMLDGEMKPVTLSESSLSLIVTAGEDSQTFDLASKEPTGGSAFSSNDAKLMKMLDGDHVMVKIRVNIDGKPFTGTYDHHGHDHDHDHDHDGDDHEH